MASWRGASQRIGIFDSVLVFQVDISNASDSGHFHIVPTGGLMS